MKKLTDFKYGQIYVNDKDFYIGRCMLEYGQYCEEELDVCYFILKSDDNVIEVGSNIGALTIPLSYKIYEGTLFSFEPQKVIYDMLVDSLEENNISNVITYNIAVGDQKKDVYIPNIDYNRFNNFGGITLSNQGNKVQQDTLDNLIDVSSLKLIKVDVEGMEYEVIKGASELIKKHRPYIYFENDRPNKSQRLLEYVASLGYRIYSHKSSLFNPENFKGNTTNIFSKNFICNNAIAIPEELNINSNLKPIIF